MDVIFNRTVPRAAGVQPLLNLARNALRLEDPFAAEILIERAIQQATDTSELLRVMEFVTRAWQADRWFFPAKNQLLREAVSRARALMLQREAELLGAVAV